MITSKDFKDILLKIAEKVEVEKEYLSELDRKTGDGDHGVTMSIGWQAITEKLKNDLQNESDSGVIAKEVGKTFLNAVGSSVGPLYATGFLRGSKILSGKEELDSDALIQFWITFGEGIQDRGKAEVGDKTMVDTFAPFVEVLKTEKNDFLGVFGEAIQKAKEGMESTADMISKRGRSSRLGERSKGSIDPGAASAYLIVETFYTHIKSLQNA